MNVKKTGTQKGKNQSNLQEMNRSLILRLLKKNNVCSRAKLAKQSGLKQATITNIINDFLNWGLVNETGIISGEKGRSSIGIQINHQNYYVIGVRLARGFFRIGLFDIFGINLNQSRFDHEKSTGPEVVVAKIKLEISRLIEKNRDKNIIGIGIAIPGPYFSHEGRIVDITDFPGWSKIQFKEEMASAFDLPVVIDHDANAGAVAEWWIAPNKQLTGTMVYLAVEDGLGAGIIHDGVLFRGAMGTAGEIGHVSINLDGPLCVCGNRGCLTNYASSKYLMERTREELPGYPDSMLREGFSYQDVVRAVKAGDPLAVAMFRETVRNLAAGMINILCAYSPNEIVIGGMISEFGEYLLKVLEEYVHGHTFPNFTEQVTINLSTLGPDPSFVGAAALAIDYCLRQASIFENAIRT